MTNAKADVSLRMQSEAFETCLEASRDLQPEMQFFKHKFPGRCTDEDAAERYLELTKMVRRTIELEREKTNYEKVVKSEENYVDQMTRSKADKPKLPAAVPGVPNGKGKKGDGKGKKGDGKKGGGKGGQQNPQGAGGKGGGGQPAIRRLCVNYIFGTCRHGQNCRFEHSQPKSKEERAAHQWLWNEFQSGTSGSEPGTPRNGGKGKGKGKAAPALEGDGKKKKKKSKKQKDSGSGGEEASAKKKKTKKSKKKREVSSDSESGATSDASSS